MRIWLVFLILGALAHEQGLAAPEPFSPQAWFSANLRKVETELRSKHIHYDRSDESVRFVDPDKTSETYGMTLEVFGNLMARFNGNGKSGWVIPEPTGVGSEIRSRARVTWIPAIDEFLLDRTRHFEVINGYTFSAYYLESFRLSSPSSRELTGALRVSTRTDGTEQVARLSQEELHAALLMESRLMASRHETAMGIIQNINPKCDYGRPNHRCW